MATKAKSQKKSQLDDKTTKNRIMDAALIIFAEQGYEGASIRKIVTAAGANIAAGHYYFGSKFALYSEVILRYLEQLNDSRYDALDKLVAEANGETIPLRDVIKAYIEPHFRLSATEHGRAYAKLIARFLVERDSISAEVFGKSVFPMRERFSPHMLALFPSADEQKLFMIFQLIALTMAGGALENANWSEEPEELEKALNSITTFLSGGITALAGEE